MYKKHTFPMFLYFILEKIPATVWTSETLTPNHYVLMISNKWIYTLNLILKNESFTNSSTLMDISAIDTLNYSEIIPDISGFFKKNRLVVYYTYYIYTLKLKLTIITPSNFNVDSNLNSIDKIYSNATWLERETSEMYGLNFLNKQDVRKLLLDYGRIESPMLKDYPSEGFNDTFYNLFEENVVYSNNNLVEL
jgi:NADH:ubiquinone oxidoreductase subunit C